MGGPLDAQAGSGHLVEQARSAWYNEYKNALGIAPEEVQLHSPSAKLITIPAVESALQTQLLNAEVELDLGRSLEKVRRVVNMRKGRP